MKTKFPYGISHYETLIRQQYVFVDKTPFIERLENLNERYVFFLRPRRFGKSLFVSLLEYYYAIEHADKFTALFQNTYIGKNPTNEANTFLVLKFEFSRINTETKDTTYQGFLKNIKKGIEAFVGSNPDVFTEKQLTEIANETSPEGTMISFFSHIKNNKAGKIYILIDEYDHFTNELLALNSSVFKEIVTQNGFVRKFYETIKQATGEGLVDRLFVTGVTPITLDSMTSGFNIATNLSLDIEFNEMLGFTTQEVHNLIELAFSESSVDTDKIKNDMREWYNGYLFHPKAENRVYNSDMVLYFLNHFNRLKTYPDTLLDINIATDYGKLKRYTLLFTPENNKQTLQELLDNGQITAQIVRQFSFETSFTSEHFKSLLFYMGMLAINSERFGSFLLQIPNYVMKGLYLDYFVSLLQSQDNIYLDTSALQEAIFTMAEHGKPDKFAQEIEKILSNLSNRDSIQLTEKHLKLIIVALLYNTSVYYVKSEYETEKKYVDIALLERLPVKVNFQFAFELKYIPKKDAKKKNDILRTATEQMKNYLQTTDLASKTNLLAYVMLIVGQKVDLIKT